MMVHAIGVVLREADDRERKLRALSIADRMHAHAWVHFLLSLDPARTLPESCAMQSRAEYLFERALAVSDEAGARYEARLLGFDKFPRLCRAAMPPEKSATPRRLSREGQEVMRTMPT